MRKEFLFLISEGLAEKIISENDSVRLLDEIVDDLDLNDVYEAYSKTGRKWATKVSTPKIANSVCRYTKNR